MCSYGIVKLTADDAACKDEIDNAILVLASLGIVTHVAAFTTYGRLKNFSQRLGTAAALGIHFNLSSGTPLSDPSLIKSLIDGEGRFHCPTPNDAKHMHGSLANFLNERVPQFIKSEMRIEMSSQLAAFEEAVGRPPAFFTMHHDLDQVPVVREAMALVVQNELGRQSLLESGAIAGVFCTFLTTQDNLTSARTKIHSMLDRALRASKSHRGAVAEIVCHPGYASGELADFTVYVKQRELELSAWSDPVILRTFDEATRSNEGWRIKDIPKLQG